MTPLLRSSTYRARYTTAAGSGSTAPAWPKNAGTCYVTLGRHDLAEAALVDALQGTLTARRKAGVLTDLAMIGVHHRDPDQVITYADAVLATARQTRSGVIAQKVRVLQPYLGPMLNDQQIQRLAAEITDLVGNRAA